MRLLSSVMYADDRSAPIRIRSLAYSRSAIVTCDLSSRDALHAALLTKLASSAPLRPGVPRARMSKCASGDSSTFWQCSLRMSSRPFTSGFGTSICLSKRPGRSSALSRISGKLVAPITMSPSEDANPSSSVRIWLRVCRSDCWSVMERVEPMASISSMKTMHGVCFFAALNRSRTRRAPTPTYISSNSEPDAYLNGTPASPAMALASSVLPVPGGPHSSTPLVIFPPSRVNLAGSFRYATMSSSSFLASSTPTTSAKEVLVLVPSCPTETSSSSSSPPIARRTSFMIFSTLYTNATSTG
mmetsp:Transcript_19086/g.45859  ORF Transcript_19086/g.45859 Transcript_19086/m.45859 type:complete len:300 (+) Transcript_19086:1036-1935(+)